jgi:uncharacterized membrane protein
MDEQNTQVDQPKVSEPKTQSRWRSRVLWAALIAQVAAIGQMTGLWTLIGIPQNMFTDVAGAVLQLLAIVGIFNDPTNRQGW